MKPLISALNTAPAETRNAAGGKSAVNHLRRKSHPAKIAAARQNIGSSEKNSTIHTIIPALGEAPAVIATGRSNITARLAASAHAVVIMSRRCDFMNVRTFSNVPPLFGHNFECEFS